MTKEQIKADIRQFIETKIIFEGFDISDQQNLFEAKYVDSISFLYLIQFIESRFSINFDKMEIFFENFENLDKIATLIETKLNRQPDK